jgi:hypothetical protein
MVARSLPSVDRIWFVNSRAVVMHGVSHAIFGARQTHQDRFWREFAAGVPRPLSPPAGAVGEAAAPRKVLSRGGRSAERELRETHVKSLLRILMGAGSIRFV